MLEDTEQQSQTGIHVHLRSEWFTLLDYANEVALLTEMPEILVLSLELMDYEAYKLGIKINWAIHKNPDYSGVMINIESCAGADGGKPSSGFLYFGSHIEAGGGSGPEVRWRIAIVRNCMSSLQRGWTRNFVCFVYNRSFSM